jgi:hypothetical protein
MSRDLEPRFGSVSRRPGARPRRPPALAAWLLVAVMVGMPACAAGSFRLPRLRLPQRTQPAPPPATPAPVALSRPPITAEVGVRTGSSLGTMPDLFRPSAMLTSTGDDAKQLLIGLPGQLGAVRWGLSWLLDNTRTPADYAKALGPRASVAKPFADKGARVIVSFEGMPWWLSSRQQTGIAGPFGWATYKAVPPKDYAAYENWVYETVKVVAPYAGAAPLYEFWNEPNSKSFWLGSKDELFRTYDAFTRGVRRADPRARVGGLAVGSWDNTREGDPAGSPPLLQSFLLHARDAKVPVDFVSWHAYAHGPEDRVEGGLAVRRWLTAAGLPAETPQVVDEWNLWASFPNNSDYGRDGVQGAAFIPADLLAFERGKIALQTICNLQDFSDAPPGQSYVGNFGTLTKGPTLKKAEFHVLEMLGRMETARVAVDVPPDVWDVEGVGALAAASSSRATVLVYRYAGDIGGSILRLLQRAGYMSLYDLGLTKDQFLGYLAGKAPLPAGTSPSVKAAIDAAFLKAKTGWASQVTLQLKLDGWSPPFRWALFRSDEAHLNPGDAYFRVRSRGGSLNDGLAAAREQQSFTPVASGTGALPDIPFGRYGVALVTIER